ncbi:uncharacterized protein N7483_004931 [Penicillium malachiteum]|uniref:uncharacterized protein n=1 Tax=Penicillium malachiteum TaxID=1324776 RepID=UPI00254775BB|nr:uncharacterized protein N7483_004931 [Penicillium malachiteum]KAJ5730423.1 hypothetical protein N7483_004931 [Penicillium malachiteum]
MDHQDADDAIEPFPQEIPVEKSESPTGDTTPTRPLSQASQDTPFRKWVDSFRSHKRPGGTRERIVEGWPDPDEEPFPAEFDLDPPSFAAQDALWERGSGNSSNLGTPKTTTISIARSRATTHSTTTQSALSDVRVSGDSSRPASSSCVDEQVEIRARKRRHILRELMTTEVNYVSGLKALAGVLSMLNVRTQIRHNIQQIHDIHEQFLSNLEMEKRRKSLMSEPSEALEVAREIEALDIALLRRSITDWSVYDKGIEALSKSVASTASRRHEENKSMLMSDLMIKPIQRLCKYPLILTDLVNVTPSSDCPSANAVMHQVLQDMRAQVGKINSATGNPVNKDRIEKTLLLQKKTRFNESYRLRDIYKELGPMILCGVLHVTYRTQEHTAGEFMVSVLFNCHLLLGRIRDEYHGMEILACIYIADLKMDTLQNGRGLTCYGCPFSWKIVFQDQGEIFELVLSASTPTEEKQWHTEIMKLSVTPMNMAKSGGVWDPRKYSLLSLPLMPLDRPQYTVAALSRRTSMDSMAISRKVNVQRVIIRKTNFPNYDESTSSGSSTGEIERPKTPVTRGSYNVIARRQDRIRLEKLIEEVYTRDALPWPGMVLGKGDILEDIFSPGSIIRRFSLHTGFNKRSSSVSTSHSGAVVTESQYIEEYDGEEKDLIATLDGDKNSSEPNFESPKTPTPSLGRSRTLRFASTPKKSVSLQRSEKQGSQESNPEPSPRKKWSSPMSLFSVLSPKNLSSNRAKDGQMKSSGEINKN